MLKTVKPEQLSVGMYVIIPKKWMQHPFIKNNFMIRSEEQIKKLIKAGIDQVQVDSAKSLVSPSPAEEHDPDSPESAAAEGATPPLIPEHFGDIIKDKRIDPHKRAEVVYRSSLDIMQRLLEEPTTENLQAFKEGARDIVDLILNDDETALHLLSITAHDFNTYTHSVNVGVLSILLAKALFGNTALHNMDELGAGFFLHDIGKINISNEIINKQGPLTEDERSVMRTHPEEGFTILTKAKQLSPESKIIVLQHHERYDGHGYPEGIQGDQIHTYGMICALADVYDALTSIRPYKPQLRPFDALKVMRDEMIYHFHQKMFEKFVLLFKA